MITLLLLYIGMLAISGVILVFLGDLGNAKILYLGGFAVMVTSGALILSSLTNDVFGIPATPIVLVINTIISAVLVALVASRFFK